MFNFQLATPEDLKVAASIEHKRQTEEARKQRVFNPRSRRIGIDRAFLDRQIEEKERQRQLERAKECRMDEALVRSSKLAIMLEKREEEEKRKINSEINTFRRVYQRPEDRRDYDLYDPDALRKSLPARVNDDDPRLGPASAQKFDGEDCRQAERTKIQKEQMQSWLIQQVAERRAAEKERRDAESAYQEAVFSRDKRATALHRMEEECRRRLNEATARFNRALAQEKDHRRRCETIQDEEDKRADIYNHVTGDFLTEAKEQADSNRGPNKPLASRYKGMSSAEIKVIRDEQSRQMMEIERMKLEERRKNAEWDEFMASNARAAENYHRDLERKRAQLSKQIARDNLELAQQQKTHQDYLKSVVYKNKPSAAFFEQFNKSTR